METFRKHDACEKVPLEECWKIIGGALVGVKWVGKQGRQGEAGVPLQASREGDQEGQAGGSVRGDPAA